MTDFNILPDEVELNWWFEIDRFEEQEEIDHADGLKEVNDQEA